MSISLFALAVVSALLRATDSFTVSDFESFLSSSRSSMLFSPAVGCVLVLPAVGYALSVLLIFPWCWVCSSCSPRTRVAFFLLLTTGSLAVVQSLIPPASLCGSLQLPGCLVWHLQHHYVAMCHCVIAGSRKVLGLLGRVVYNNAFC